MSTTAQRRKSGQFQLLNEQTVDSMTVFEAIVKSWRNMPAHDKVRIVVEPFSEKSTAVHVSYPAAARFRPVQPGKVSTSKPSSLD